MKKSDVESLWSKMKKSEITKMEYNNEIVKRKGYKDWNEYRNIMDHKKGIYQSMSENKNSPVYLGIFIAERMLHKIYENVEMMSYGNPSYDAICNKGLKIDVKSSSLYHNNTWYFAINKNEIADQFLMIAFDNRTNLNVIHIWCISGNELIKNKKLNKRTGFVIINGKKSLEKYSKYKITDKLVEVNEICNEFKEKH